MPFKADGVQTGRISINGEDVTRFVKSVDYCGALHWWETQSNRTGLQYEPDFNWLTKGACPALIGH